MKTLRARSGMSLVEILLVGAIVAVIVVAAGTFFSRTMTFYKRVRFRQQLVLQSRSCIDTIVQILKYGKAKSVIISTPASIPVVPNSRIDFVLQDPLQGGTTAYSFFMSNGRAMATEYRLSGTKTTRVLATNVTSLMFTGDSRDPAVINVSLRFDIPFDSTGQEDHSTSLILPNQVVQMKMTP